MPLGSIWDLELSRRGYKTVDTRITSIPGCTCGFPAVPADLHTLETAQLVLQMARKPTTVRIAWITDAASAYPRCGPWPLATVQWEHTASLFHMPIVERRREISRGGGQSTRRRDEKGKICRRGTTDRGRCAQE